MEIIVALGLLVCGLLIWLVARGRQDAPTPQLFADDASVSPVATATSGGAPLKKPESMNADGCWLPPGHETTIAGYSIPDGMLYVGRALPSITGYRVEPALIDPSLPVNRSSPNRAGEGMTYWPSYNSISPESRAAYLEWLAAGRRDPGSYIGYVFLYFYGLERRALFEAARTDAAKQDLPAIRIEVEQLLQVYNGNASFRGYAAQLLDVLKILTLEVDTMRPPTESTGYDLPISVRFAIGRIIAAGKPIPPEWALSWFLTHPETQSRTPAQRCPDEFSELFRTRYRREFGDGLVLKPNQTKLKIAISPSSASFGGKVELSMDLPDVAAVTSPLSKLRQIGDGCAADLDGFSRWVGRNPDAPKTIAAVAMLPSELTATCDSHEVRQLWHWLGRTVETQGLAVCNSDELLSHCPSFGSGKLAKSEAVLLAQLLEKGGYGIEPDVRFGGAPLAPEGVAIIFKLVPGFPAVASPQYIAATVLMQLAVTVSAADGSISLPEREYLQEHLQRGLSLTDAERLRLSAHLAWLVESPPSLTGLKKRLEPLDTRQRSSIADFMIGVAGADGQITPDEIRTLGKIYPMLGMPADAVYSHVHAMEAGVEATIQGNEPVTVVPGQPVAGYSIPRPKEIGAVQLDMTAVKAKLAESAQISAILEDIFAEDEPAGVAPPSAAVPEGKASSPHNMLLSRLLERPEWSRAEFESVAGEFKLLPDGAIDKLNEAAFEHSGGPVIEGEDPIYIDTTLAQELLA
jgi:uncharacterized tellurite resistance protein B-like protein